jgi:beta-phosphoglucomutase
MDGVLVDSYHAHARSWQVMAAKWGRTMTAAQFDATFGRTSRDIIAALWPEAKYSEDEIAAMDASKEAAFRGILAADFRPMPGVERLLARLFEAGVPMAVGSSGPPENVDLVLSLLGKRPWFASIVTGMDVTRGKPDPQVFLLAAQRLGVPPQQCVVVEDSPLGIVAAKAAGMAGVGLASTGRSPWMHADADLAIDTLEAVSPRVLCALVKPRSDRIVHGWRQFLDSVPRLRRSRVGRNQSPRHGFCEAVAHPDV